jgi:hypothetical protein
MQASRPIADVFNTGCSPATNYFSRLNESPPNDSSVVTSSDDPQDEVFEVRLRPLAWPVAGPMKLKVRLRRTSLDVPTTLMLIQGTILIATKTVSPSDVLEDFAIDLPAEQLVSIRDFRNLRLRVAANVPRIDTPCCPLRPVSSTLIGRVSCTFGGFTCLPEVVVFEYSPLEMKYIPTELLCCNIGDDFRLICDGGQSKWHIQSTAIGKFRSD